MPTAYPTTAEVTTRLTEMGVTAPSNATITSAVNAIVHEWERITGYYPFLAETADSTNYYEPKSTFLLDFENGYVSVTSIKIGVTYANATGTVLVDGQDYTLFPTNAVRQLKPFTYIKSRRLFHVTHEASVKVIGKRGYAVLLPDDVYEAVMREVLSYLLTPAHLAITGGMEAWKEGDIEERYGASLNNPMISAGQTFSEGFRRAAIRYRRPRMA